MWCPFTRRRMTSVMTLGRTSTRLGTLLVSPWRSSSSYPELAKCGGDGKIRFWHQGWGLRRFGIWVSGFRVQSDVGEGILGFGVVGCGCLLKTRSEAKLEMKASRAPNWFLNLGAQSKQMLILWWPGVSIASSLPEMSSYCRKRKP